MGIGGNLYGVFQIKGSGKKNKIGEVVPTWEDSVKVLGWLDLTTGDSEHTNFNAKIQESTHVFLCDYQEFPAEITSENARMIIDGLVYEIKLIDDPMHMHEHYEIYLKFVGGQNVS